jgi:ABC-2 type transport system ATP-binding protein
MGFLYPDSGDITICGYNVKKNYEKAMNLVGGIVENPEMYKEMTGLQNLQMYGRLHDGVTKERIKEVAEIVGMQSRVNERLKKYSLGMKQRIGLAQAILHKPRLLILDEPTNGLDPAGIKELRDILKKLAHEENVAVLVSSHMLAEMELMCDRVAIIDKGTILDVKPIEEILHMAARKETYRFELDSSQFEQAKQVVSSAYEEDDIVSGSELIENGRATLSVAVPSDKIPEINKLLVQNDISVYAIGRVENSLEDAFIEITGGGISIA